MIRIREGRDSDAAYVAATALHQVHRFVRHVPKDEMQLVVRAMLNASRIVVACSEMDEDTLLGWCAAIGGAPWFVFVARELRGNGSWLVALFENRYRLQRLMSDEPELTLEPIIADATPLQ